MADQLTCVRAPHAITSSGLARRRLLRSPVPVDTKIKTTKINSEGLLRLFTKFSTPENYLLYGNTKLDTVYKVSI